MGDLTKLSRREREMMEVIYGRGEATVLQVQAGLADAPSGMALRRMLSILEEKGYVRRRKEGREFVYMPVQARAKAGKSALQRVLDTFFEGAVDEALATHLARPGVKLSAAQVERMRRLIEEAEGKG